MLFSRNVFGGAEYLDHFCVRVVDQAMVIGQVIYVDEMFIPFSGIGGGTHP